jgi:hypothetical protein
MNDLLNQQVPSTDQKSDVAQVQCDYILLDGSSSMHERWADSTTAIDEYVRGLRANDVNTQVSLAVFGTRGGFAYDAVRDNVKPEDWQDVFFDEQVRNTGGMTPLYDAINTMGRVLRDKMPTKCSIMIVTDGDENDSKTNATQALSILNWCRRRGWQVTFVGVDFNNATQAHLLGATDDNLIGLDRKRLSDASSKLATKRHYYDRYGSPMGFTNDEKKELGGYLPDMRSAK